MKLHVLIVGLLLCIPLAWYSGYLIGKVSYAPNSPVTNDKSSRSLQANDTDSINSPQTEKIEQTQSLSHSQADTEQKASSNVQVLTGENIEPLLQAHGNALEETGRQLAGGQHQKAHTDMRQKFEQQYAAEDEDWQAKTNFTDYLQLHENADLILLHRIICTSQQCQLIGQFNGEHQQWKTILDGMEVQDWWNYSGTSSSSSTRDGVTYFNVYVDKVN